MEPQDEADAQGRETTGARRRRLRLRAPSRLAGAALFGGALGLALMVAPDLRQVALNSYQRVSAVLLAQPEFVIRRVEITGAPHLSDAQVLVALGLDQGPTRSLDFNAKGARWSVESLGWVKSATVRASPPQLVEVMIEERTLAARWRRGGRLALIDAGGAIIADHLAPERGLRGGATRTELIRAPLLIGAGADRSVAEALRLDAAARAAGLRPVALTRIGERRWDVQLDGGPLIMLPEEDPEAALAQLIDWARDTLLFDHGFTVLDFRDPLAPVGRPSP